MLQDSFNSPHKANIKLLLFRIMHLMHITLSVDKRETWVFFIRVCHALLCRLSPIAKKYTYFFGGAKRLKELTRNKMKNTMCYINKVN